MREKNKKKIYLIFFVLLIFSCQNKNKIPIQNITNVTLKEEIRLIEDFNLDNHPDTLKIINRDNKNSDLVISFFNNHTSLISKKAIFPNEELYSEGSQSIIDISYKNKTIILNQEYGSASPEGWYTCYINYNLKSKKFTVDSIEHSWKNFNAKSDSDFIKTKTKLMKMNLEDFNAKSEFHNFK